MRKFESIRIPVSTLQPVWEEVAFSEIKKCDIVKITDYDDNGIINGEDGKTIFIVKEPPHVEDNTVGFIADVFEGTVEEALTFVK